MILKNFKYGKRNSDRRSKKYANKLENQKMYRSKHGDHVLLENENKF